MTQQHHDFERELASMLREAGESFHASPQALAAGGLRRGRARQWRRRAGMATGALSVAALTAAALTIPGSGGDAGPADVPASGREMIDTLIDLLPAGLEIDSVQGSGPGSVDSPYVSVTVADGGGSVEVDLSLHRWTTEDWTASPSCADFEEESCTERTLEDGSRLTLVSFDDSETVWDDAADGEHEPLITRSWDVWLTGPGGAGLDEPGSRVVSLSLTRDFEEPEPDYQPPLDFEAMTEVVRAPVWQRVLDAVDAQHGPPTDRYEDGPASHVAAELIHDALRELLPGLEITALDEGGQGEAAVLLDDGRGPARLDVTLWAPGWYHEDELDFRYLDEEDECSAEARAEGGWIQQCLWPTEANDPWSVWSLSLSYGDGSGLDIQLTNASDFDTEPEREDIPLTEQQIAELAQADIWQALLGTHS